MLLAGCFPVRETCRVSSVSRPKLPIALAGLLLPGLGHFFLGRRRRALVFFCLLSLLFYAGVFLEQDFFSKFGYGILKSRTDQSSGLREVRDDLEGAVDKTWKVVFTYAYPFFVGFGNYVVGLKWVEWAGPYIVNVPGVAKATEIPVTTRDIGYCFALLAGLLNLLIMMDAYDIACNEEELERRRAQ